MSKREEFYGSYSSGCADADVIAFLAATGIADVTIADALCVLVTDLKAALLWTKFNALYPFVGGTATTHKYNLKDPQDTDAAFRLTFSGGWTHASTGVLPNGTNAYAHSHIPDNTAGLNDVSHSMYSRTDNNVGFDEGSYDDVSFPASVQYIIVRRTGLFYSRMNEQTGNVVANADGRGFYIGLRSAANIFKGYKNGVEVISDVTASTRVPGRHIFLGALNLNGSPNLYASKEFALYAYGSSLSGAEVATLYTIVQAFQTSLSRQV